MYLKLIPQNTRNNKRDTKISPVGKVYFHMHVIFPVSSIYYIALGCLTQWIIPLICYIFWLWASCQIRRIVGCACTGNAGNVFPRHRLQRKSLVSDHGMHHGTCAAHVPWCMPGSLTRGSGENVPGIPGACASCNVTYLARSPWHKMTRLQLTLFVAH